MQRPPIYASFPQMPLFPIRGPIIPPLTTSFSLHHCAPSIPKFPHPSPAQRLFWQYWPPSKLTCLVRCSTATSFLVVQMRAKIADRVSLRSYSVLPTSCFSQPVVGALCRHCRIRGRFRARIMPSHPSREFRESPKPGITINPSSAILEHTRRMCRRSRHRICRR
jgi:hypothetical protein